MWRKSVYFLWYETCDLNYIEVLNLLQLDDTTAKLFENLANTVKADVDSAFFELLVMYFDALENQDYN